MLISGRRGWLDLFRLALLVVQVPHQMIER